MINKQNKIVFVLILILLSLDRITKIVFKDKYFWIINYNENTGVIFGLFKKNIVFSIIFSILILLFVVFLIFKNNNFKFKVGLSFIFAGILSNLLDRIFLGHVIDFIDFKFWWIFNLSDVFSLIGISLIIISMKNKK